MSATRIWAGLDPATRRAAAEAVYRSTAGGESGRREADAAIAATLRFRPAAVRQLSVERRIEHIARSVRPDEGLASTLLLAFHLDRRRPLLEAFLDALGIPHDGGLIDGGHELTVPDEDRLAAAAASLRASFPAEEVELYFACLVAMDPDVWGGLASAAVR